MPESEKVIYLTFDDGPVPKVTPWALEILKAYNAKATFFCVGENVKKHPGLFRRIREEGHSVGNHSYNHINGWRTRNFSHMRNIARADHLINSRLYRPPYGKIKLSQLRQLRGKYKVVMWDVLSGDYNQKLKGEQCLANVIENTGPGSVICFHDSEKAWENLRYTLPKVLAHYKKMGFSFEALH